jgi:hypothetical protein
MINPCVVAFPRSGTHFLRRVIGYSQGLTGYDLEKFYQDGYNDHEIELLLRSDIPVITILRDPKDCIPSAIILGTIMQGLEIKPYLFENNAKQYIDFYAAASKSVDTIYPILFEQLSDNLEKTIENLASSLGINVVNKNAEAIVKKIFLQDANDKYKIVANSSKNHERYEEIVLKYSMIDRDFLIKLSNSYADFRDAVIKRQSDLGWTW